MEQRDLFAALFIPLIALSTLVECSWAGNKLSNGKSSKESTRSECSKFTTTFEGFFPLVDNEYWIRARRDAEFQENISLSMYRYYMAQHLYARLVQLRAEKHLADADEMRFANHVQSLAPSVPIGVFTYLNAIGDITITTNNGAIRQHCYAYDFLIWPNQEGHFGDINETNHWMYMSFPAPTIVFQAMPADLRMEPDSSSVWDISVSMDSSRKQSEGSPTANLLGWKPSVVLTPAQRRNLQSSGIDKYIHGAVNSQFLFNPKLMTIIHEYFQDSSQATVNINEEYNNNPGYVGRTIQLGWLVREIEAHPRFSDAFSFVEKDVVGKLHPLQPYSKILNKFSLIMGFRVKKYAAAINDWAIYNFDNYRRVPDNWTATRNTLFEFGDIAHDNGIEIEFSLKRDAIRGEILRKMFNGDRPMYANLTASYMEM